MNNNIFNLAKITKFINSLRWRRIFHATWLPLGLAVIFVLQNQAFVGWLNIEPTHYLIRRSLVTFSLGLILYGPAILFKKRKYHAYLFLMSLAVSTIFISQFVYFKYSGGFLQASALKYAGLAISVTGTVWTLLEIQLLFFLVNLLIWILAMTYYQRRQTIENYLLAGEKIILTIMFIAVAVVGYGHLLRAETKEWGDTTRLYRNLFDMNNFVSKVGIVNFFLEDASKHILGVNRVTDDDKIFLKNWSDTRINATSTSHLQAKYFGVAKNRNVILIQVESLDNAVVNQDIAGQEITPELNKLIKDNLNLPNYFSQFGQGTTADAEFSVLNSLYPLLDDVAFIQYAKNQYNALPRLLNENGYQALAFHGDVQTFWNRANIYPELGYNQWFSRNDYVLLNPIGGAFDMDDQDFFEQTLVKIKKLPQPFMATLMTLSTHTPFSLPINQRELSFPATTTLDYNQQQYLQTVRYVDKQIGHFIDQLEKNGLLENSLVLIYGDHGSYTNVNKKLGEKNTLFGLDNSRVPLIIIAPKTELTGVISAPASHLDLYPTVANLLGIKPPKSILGQDIFNTTNPVFTRRKNISGNINTIFSSTLGYQSAADGIFEHGACLAIPSEKSLPTQNCLSLYNQQADILKISDIVVRGNLLKTLAD